MEKRGQVQVRTSDIPHTEVRRLALRVEDARDLAASGAVRRGYSLMLAGFGHAERALLEGRPWAGALARLWRDAIDRFCADYDPNEED